MVWDRVGYVGGVEQSIGYGRVSGVEYGIVVISNLGVLAYRRRKGHVKTCVSIEIFASGCWLA